MRKVTISIDGIEVRVPAGSTVAAAIISLGKPVRTSIRGDDRAALCAMGTCFECRAIIDGRPHVRTCQKIVRDGMVVETL